MTKNVLALLTACNDDITTEIVWNISEMFFCMIPLIQQINNLINTGNNSLVIIPDPFKESFTISSQLNKLHNDWTVTFNGKQ